MQTTKYSLESSLFSRCNHTELYQACVRAELLVRPDESREAMISYLEGLDEPPPLPEADHSLHAWRHGIMGFLLDYWKQVETQITCPAKSKDPRSCFGCLDTQVITCIVQNPENERLIALHKPKRNQ